MTTSERLVTCPECDTEEAIAVELEWVSGEMYGTDADGNRGIWIEGHYEAINVGPCVNGCRLDSAEEEKIIKDVEESVSQDSYDYTGPDREEELDD